MTLIEYGMGDRGDRAGSLRRAAYGVAAIVGLLLLLVFIGSTIGFVAQELANFNQSVESGFVDWVVAARR